MDKPKFNINEQTLTKLGISVEESIKHLESKEANELSPAMVRGHFILKKNPPIVSSRRV